jgi:hypothetical protein
MENLTLFVQGERGAVRELEAAFRGRPPSLPFSREARAFVALRCAPTRAAGPTMSTFVGAVVETRATRTRASGRLSGCASSGTD